MDKNLFSKNIIFGFFTWLIPFIISILFYSPSGEIIIDDFFFKSLMITISSITGCVFLIQYFKNVGIHFIKTGVAIGLSWIIIGIILDIIILIPTMNLTITGYLTLISLRYVVILLISITIGYFLNKKNKVLFYSRQ